MEQAGSWAGSAHGWRAVSIALLLGTGNPSLPMPAQAATGAQQGNVGKGQVIFVKYCAGCHGSKGQGDGYRLLGPNPANLTEDSTKKKSDAELLKTIHEGKSNMPAWDARFADEESRDVLAYIRTLGRR